MKVYLILHFVFSTYMRNDVPNARIYEMPNWHTCLTVGQASGVKFGCIAVKQP